MTDLVCCVDYCKHNEQNKCCRGRIEVGGYNATEPETTFCSSYEERMGNKTSNACCTPDSKIEIKCDASNCMYNDNHNCTAGHVDVGHSISKGKTECTTFKMKK